MRITFDIPDELDWKLRKLGEYKKMTPEEYEAQLQEGRKLIITSNFKEAAAQFEELEVVNPKDGRVHKALGVCYAKLYKKDKMCKQYREYLKIDPSAADAEKVKAILSGPDCK